MPAFQWARLKANEKHPLRRGAWYRVLKLTASEAVVVAPAGGKAHAPGPRDVKRVARRALRSGGGGEQGVTGPRRAHRQVPEARDAIHGADGKGPSEKATPRIRTQAHRHLSREAHVGLTERIEGRHLHRRGYDLARDRVLRLHYEGQLVGRRPAQRQGAALTASRGIEAGCADQRPDRHEMPCASHAHLPPERSFRATA